MIGRKPVLELLAFFSIMFLIGPVLVSVAAAPDRVAGVVTALQGSATVRHGPAPGPRPLKLRDDVYLSDQITTGEDSIARILLGGKALLTLRDGSTVHITEKPGVTTVHVDTGRTHINVNHERMKATPDTVEVRSPNAVARVTGTILVTEVVLGGECGVVSTFTVLRGNVEVTTVDAAGAKPASTVDVASMQQVTIGGCARERGPRLLSYEEAETISAGFRLGPRLSSLPPAPPPRVGNVVSVQGSVSVRGGPTRRAGARGDILRPQDDLFVNDRIATDDQSLVRLFLIDRATVWVRESSRLTFRGDLAAPIINLDTGAIRVAAPQSAIAASTEIYITTANTRVSLTADSTCSAEIIIEAQRSSGACTSGLSSRITVVSGSARVWRRDSLTGHDAANRITLGELQSLAIDDCSLTSQPSSLTQSQAERLRAAFE
jgi:hypothetical protein